jgi:hypothetical protein
MAVVVTGNTRLEFYESDLSHHLLETIINKVNRSNSLGGRYPLYMTPSCFLNFVNRWAKKFLKKELHDILHKITKKYEKAHIRNPELVCAIFSEAKKQYLRRYGIVDLIVGIPILIRSTLYKYYIW